MEISNGRTNVIIGLIDGPIDFNHPAFRGSEIKTVKDCQLGACKSASSVACAHGTFVVGILSAKRDLSAHAICPNCGIVLHPIFRAVAEGNNSDNGIIFPNTTQEELSNAIIETIYAGANIINLSLGLSSSSLIVNDKMQQAYDYAVSNNVIIVIAAVNQGNVGIISLIIIDGLSQSHRVMRTINLIQLLILVTL
jgi:subtilisin family serine protease